MSDAVAAISEMRMVSATDEVGSALARGCLLFCILGGVFDCVGEGLGEGVSVSVVKRDESGEFLSDLFGYTFSPRRVDVGEVVSVDGGSVSDYCFVERVDGAVERLRRVERLVQGVD